MTLVVLWQSPDGEKIKVLADSRLRIPQGVLTGKMPKIFILNVSCFSVASSRPEKLFDQSIGMAFAGYGSIAFATVAILQNYLASLVVHEGDATPSLFDVARFAAWILADNYKDFGQLWPYHSDCEIIIFGALPSDPKVRAILMVTSKNERGEPIVEVDEWKGGEGQVLVLGSGRAAFENTVTAIASDGSGLLSGFHKTVMGGHPDIGGSVQVAIATRTGVSLPHVILPRPDGSGVDFVFAGRATGSGPIIGHAMLGTTAISEKSLLGMVGGQEDA